MFKQTLTSIRPNKDVPFFHEAAEHAEIQELRTSIRENNTQLVLSRTVAISSDELTFTNTLTYPDEAAFNTYVALVKSTVPNWPQVRNKYYKDNNHILIVETKVQDKPPTVLFTI